MDTTIEVSIMDIEQLISIVTMIVTVASAIAIVTPTPMDNVVLKFIKQVLNVLALNMGKAKNKDD